MELNVSGESHDSLAFIGSTSTERDANYSSSICSSNTLIRNLRNSSSEPSEHSAHSSENAIHVPAGGCTQSSLSDLVSKTKSNNNHPVSSNSEDQFNRNQIDEFAYNLDNISIDQIPLDHGGYFTDSSDEENFDDISVDEDAPAEVGKKHKLDKALHDDEYNEPLDSPISMSKIAVMLAVLKFCIKYHVPTAGIVDLFKMLNMFINNNIFPENNYQLNNLFSQEKCKQYHAICPVCKVYLGTFGKGQRSILCETCDENVNLKDPSYCDYFIILDVASELKSVIEANQEFYIDVVSRRNKLPNTTYRDIYDGQKYKQFVGSLPVERKESYFTVTFNSDGSPVFKSSKYSIWPIQIVVNEIPLNVRSEKTITCALWFGRNKPNMTYFLRPFVEQMNELTENGIIVKLQNEGRKLYLYALCCCVDSVARAPMQGTVQFNGYYGCNWCLHPGESIRHDTGYSIKYPILDVIPERRTAAATFELMQRSVASNNPVLGIKNVTALLLLYGYNIIDGFVPCPLHVVDRGIGNQFVNYWLSPHHPYSIPKNKMKDIDKYLKTIKVPTQLTRLSRSLSDRAFWKAVEWCNWILFYSIPVLKLVSSEFPAFEPYLNHWSLLVEAYFILLRTEISVTELRRADLLLKRFVFDTEILYTTDAMTYNVHQLLHLAQSVADWGPLFSHSGYVFESGNGRIKKSIYAANGVLSQVCRYLSFEESLRKLQKHEEMKDENSPCIQYVKCLDNKVTESSVKFAFRYFGRTTVNAATLRQFEFPVGTVRAYKKIVKDGCPFKTSEKILYRSDNSFAILQNQSYIEIQQFLVSMTDVQEYVTYKKVNVSDDHHLVGDELHCMKKVIEINEDIEITLTKYIDKPCVYLNIEGNHYISCVPNMYWR